MSETVNQDVGDAPDALTLIQANLASLNELFADLVEEVVSALRGGSEYAEVAVDVMRKHNWTLGFEFRGERAPADFDPAAWLADLPRSD